MKALHKIRDVINPMIFPGLSHIGQHSFLNNENKDHLLFLIPVAVASKYGMDVSLLLGKSRKAEIVLARQVAAWAICLKTNLTLKAIAKYFNCDHSTIIYCRDTIQGFMKVDKKFRREMELFIKEL